MKNKFEIGDIVFTMADNKSQRGFALNALTLQLD